MFKPFLEVLERIAAALETLAGTREDFLRKQARETYYMHGKVAWGYQGKPRVYQMDEERQWLNQQPAEVQAEYRKVDREGR